MDYCLFFQKLENVITISEFSEKILIVFEIIVEEKNLIFYGFLPIVPVVRSGADIEIVRKAPFEEFGMQGTIHLVEEIFGDIEDEHDNNNYIAKQLPTGEFHISARIEIEKANDLLDIDLPESDEYLTVGGWILNEYQSFPKLNEIVKFGQWEFKIIEKTTTKIELVRLKVLV